MPNLNLTLLKIKKNYYLKLTHDQFVAISDEFVFAELSLVSNRSRPKRSGVRWPRPSQVWEGDARMVLSISLH